MASAMSVEELLALQARIVGELGDRAARGIDFSRMSLTEILAVHGALARELQRRRISRTGENPMQDVGIHILCVALGWTRAAEPGSGFDATDRDGRRCLVRTRRISGMSAGESFTNITGVDTDGFDVLATIALDEDYEVLRAALVPRDVVAENGEHENGSDSHALRLADAFGKDPRIVDVTRQLRAWADAPPPAAVQRRAAPARPARRALQTRPEEPVAPSSGPMHDLMLEEDTEASFPPTADAPAGGAEPVRPAASPRPGSPERRPSNRLRSLPPEPGQGRYGPLGGASSGTASPSR